MTKSDTQARIVDAAFRNLVEDGYHDTSIKDIASRAGMATGLAHYYFDSKDDLLLAALEQACPMAELDLAGMSGVDQAKLGFAAEKQWQVWNQDAYKVLFDMIGTGMHNPRLAERIRHFLNNRRALVTKISHAVVDEAENRPVASADAIGAAIWGAFLGIALQRLIDPEFDGDAALAALEEMAITAVSAPRTPARRTKSV